MTAAIGSIQTNSVTNFLELYSGRGFGNSTIAPQNVSKTMTFETPINVDGTRVVIFDDRKERTSTYEYDMYYRVIVVGGNTVLNDSGIWNDAIKQVALTSSSITITWSKQLSWVMNYAYVITSND